MATKVSAFENLLAGLVRAEVRFITVGGLACAMCGFVRATEDVDLLVDGDPDNIERLLNFLRTWGDGHAAELSKEDFTDEEGAVRIIEDFPLDIFVRMRGLRYEDLSQYCRRHDIGIAQIPYLNPHGLILLKKHSHREKDRIDILALRRLMRDSS